MNTTPAMKSSTEPITPPVVDAIIRLVSRDAPLLNDLRDAQCGVCYDRKRGVSRYLKHDPFNKVLRKYMRDDVYFIDSYEKVTIVQSCHLRSSHHLPMQLRVTYKLHAEKGGELQLVRSLAKRDTPSKLLANLLTEWMEEALEGANESWFSDFSGFFLAVEKAVKERGKAAGLHLSMQIESLTLAGEPIRVEGSLKLDARKVRIQPKGFNGYLYLSYDAVLTADHVAGAFPASSLAFRDREEAIELLTGWMQAHVRDFVEYQDVINDLRNVRGGIIAYWNHRLALLSKCWKLGDLELVADFDLKTRLDALRSSSLETVVEIFNNQVQLQVRCSVVRVDAVSWEDWSDKKYPSIEAEREGILKDISQFYKDRLESEVKIEKLAQIDVAKSALELEDSCVEYVRKRRHLTVVVENIYELENHLKAQLVQGLIELMATNHAKLVEQCKLLQAEIKNDERKYLFSAANGKKQLLEQFFNQLKNPSSQEQVVELKYLSEPEDEQ